MEKRTTSLLLLLCCTFLLKAQQPSKKFTLPADMVSFFSGKWKGEGQLSNGKPMAADVYIHPAADNSWLMYEHSDKQTNGYKSISLWSVDENTGQFLAYRFFNNSGHDQFDSDGWKENKLILVTHQLNASINTTGWQRFTYEKLTNTSFKMTFEISTDKTNWKTGLSLTLIKQ